MTSTDSKSNSASTAETSYFSRIGLTADDKAAAKNKLVETVFAEKSPTLETSVLSKLYTYREPEEGEDGTCSRIEKIKEKPFNLAEVFGLGADLSEALLSKPQTALLWRLNQIVQQLAKLTNMDCEHSVTQACPRSRLQGSGCTLRIRTCTKRSELLLQNAK